MSSMIGMSVTVDAGGLRLLSKRGLTLTRHEMRTTTTMDDTSNVAVHDMIPDRRKTKGQIEFGA